MGGMGLWPVNWSICETRTLDIAATASRPSSRSDAGLRPDRNVKGHGSNQTTFQHLWGTQYIDELIWLEKNGDPTESNDTNPDDQTGESTADERYFVHQDRNWNVVALTEYDPAGTNNGRIAERYSYTPYGSFVALTGDSGSGELCDVSLTSTVGNAFAHQGLYFDHGKNSFQNRHREYRAELQRFAQTDPLGYANGLGRYVSHLGAPPARRDPLGLQVRVHEPTIHEEVNAIEYCWSIVNGTWPWGEGWWRSNGMGWTTLDGEYTCDAPEKIRGAIVEMDNCECGWGYECEMKIHCEPDFDVYIDVNWLVATPEQFDEYPNLQSVIDEINGRILEHEFEHARRHQLLLVPFDAESGPVRRCTEGSACAEAAGAADAAAAEEVAWKMAVDTAYQWDWDEEDLPAAGEFIYSHCTRLFPNEFGDPW
jgi:RHS repeat-associated protein